ncbi:hypothetical protein C810_01501 [Lachnospiraceae bacterium A2]|nr:hypothetical protein C810_01501 [Lachnospiraceae bacterium A2]
MLEFYNQSKPKARKDHVCEFCIQTIRKGEKYSYETGKYEGEMFVRKLCLVCKNILDKFCNESGDEEFSWDWITDWLCDLYCYDCEHGTKGKGDCEMQPQNCPLIRSKFETKECTQNANPAN